MTSLIDIAAISEKVAVAGHKLEVFGISARGIAALLQRFPELQDLIRGKTPDAKTVIEVAPNAIEAIIASGTGNAGDEASEAAAGRLGVEAQFDVLAAIIRLTMPSGFGPFVARLTAAMGQAEIPTPPAAGAGASTAPATK
jgi:hypothetical protein